MGIPSYYKKLTEKVKGLISKSKPDSVDALYFDFNCIIYYCASRKGSTLPPYPGSNGNCVEWEDLLINDVMKYVEVVWRETGSPKKVSLCLDGVVPMAKIRQQRLRRFKSAFLAKKDVSPGEKWDTNCITPGTAFMRRLGLALKKLCQKRPGWSVSTTDEPGEGEHKIMAQLRKETAHKSIVYGMDADLILLTLLNAKGTTFLLREDSELGLNSLGEEQFSYFSLEHLKSAQWPGLRGDELHTAIRTYVAAMSFLGNDFLPHSLSLKIKEDGHSILLNTVKSLDKPLLLQEESGRWVYNKQAVLDILTKFKDGEVDRIAHMIKKKIQMGVHVSQERAGDIVPSEWINKVERPLIFVENGAWSLKAGWSKTYNTEWMNADSSKDIDTVCREYFYGLQWILDYYTGQMPVNMLWYFSRYIPPLWMNLHKYLEENELVVPGQVTEPSAQITPSEQLAMVLPLESWHLLEDKFLRGKPGHALEYWPLSFEFFSAGRTWLWECEPLIPILPVHVLRVMRGN